MKSPRPKPPVAISLKSLSVAGAVVMAYNLPSFKDDLKLSGPVIADMYLGKIAKWNDKAIADINPGVQLPIPPSPPFTAATAAGQPSFSPAISAPRATISKPQ